MVRITQAQLFALSELTEYLVRFLMWATVATMFAAGACLCVAYVVDRSREEAGPSACRGHRRTEAKLKWQVHRGIAEIEAFLGAQCQSDGTQQPGCP